MPTGNILDSFQIGMSSVDGMTHRRGRRRPVKTNRRRDIEIIERVSFMTYREMQPNADKGSHQSSNCNTDSSESLHQVNAQA